MGLWAIVFICLFTFDCGLENVCLRVHVCVTSIVVFSHHDVQCLALITKARNAALLVRPTVASALVHGSSSHMHIVLRFCVHTTLL